MHYRYIFTSDTGTTWKVDLMDTTDAGTTFTTVYPDANGFTLTWEDVGEDVYKAIRSSDLSVNLFRDTNSRALLDAVIAGPECRFIVMIYKLVTLTYVRYWQGFVMQDGMMKPDASDNTDFIEIRATDGFGLLKDIQYSGYDVDAITRKSVLSWLASIGTSLPVDYVLNSENFWALGSVWYEDSQTSSVVPTPEDADPLANTYISESAFLQVDEYGIVQASSLYDILEAILSVTGCQLVQANGILLIIQPNTYVQSQTRVWYYGHDGTYIDTALLTLQGTMPERFSSGEFNYILPCKEVTTEYEYRQGIYRNNLLPYNVDRTTEYSLGLSTQNAEITFNGRIETIYNGTGGDPELIQAVYKLLIQNGTKYLNQNADGELEWTTNSSNFVPVYTRSFKSDYAGDQIMLTDFALSTILPEEGEAITFEWQYYRLENFGEGTLFDDSLVTYTMSHDDIEGTFKARINTGVSMEGKQLFRAHLANSARSDIQLQSVGLGDGVNKYSAGALFVRDSSDNIVESNVWTIYSEIGGTAYPINSLRCRERLALQRNTVQIYAGSFFGNPNIHVGFVWLSKAWTWQGLTWSASLDRYNGVLMAVTLDRTGLTVDTPLTAQDETAGNTSAGSGSNGTTPEPTAQNFWSRDETNTEVYPLNIADKIAGYDSITSKDLLGNNYSSINLGDFTQQKENTISNQSRYVSGSELSNGVNLFSRVVAFSKSNIYSQFREAINTAEAWTTSSRAVEWIIETVVSGATTLSRRLRIDKDGYFYIGSSTNNTSFSPSGTQRMNGSATVWNDLNIPGLSVQFAGANDPALSDFGSTTKILSFSGATMKEVFFTVQLPHSYKEGSAIEPHVHWCPLVSPASSLGVRWGLDYQWQNNAGVYSATDSTVLATGSTGTVGYTHLITSFGTISGTGKTISSILVCRLYRLPSDAADTYTGDAGLLSIDFHYESDSLGSETEYGK